MKECEVIDLRNYHNEESYEENSEKWEANVYSKELESNVDALQMQESEINDHFSVISNPQSFTDDPNLLLNSSNDVEMQHEILSQVDITCSTLKSSSRTNRKISRKGIAEVKSDLIKQLRQRISSLEKSLQNITKLVGKENLLLLRKSKRMKDIISSVKFMFEEEGKKKFRTKCKSKFLTETSIILLLILITSY
jgi:predicted regulator of amino acid metabolism with ACT domain